MNNMDILYEETENTNIKYISFIGESNKRFDLAIIHTDRFFGKKIIYDIQVGRSAIIGKEDLEDIHYLEETFRLTEEEAKDLFEYLINFF